MFKKFTHINIIVDDFGNELYIYETNYIVDSYDPRYLSINNAVIIGSTIPGLNIQYLIHKDKLERHKLSVKRFHESEQNCNTCKFLTRINHLKSSSGFLHGKCENTVCNNNLYGSTKEHMIFHPDDPMHMECYQPRWM